APHPHRDTHGEPGGDEDDSETDDEVEPGADTDLTEPGTAGSGVVNAAFTTSAAGGGARVLAAHDTGTSGLAGSGDFTATPLLSAGSWAAGSSSGAFTYGYQLEVPESPGGLTPTVALGYSSQTVDGRTSASNNQASWLGDGWDYNPGSITRTYTSCREDAKKQGANNASHKTGDMCWGSHNATLSLGGSTTELVLDDGVQNKNANRVVYTTANGDGSLVELIKDTTTANGDADGEHWIVTTTDGTKYHFGRNRLPGWTTGQPETNSVLTVPVAGNHAGEPCHKAGDFAGSFCDQAWRWSLDYVEDVHGNAMTLWWVRETNHYARNLNFKTPVAYHRGGYLQRIDYGLRADSLFPAAPVGRVTFKVAERCFTEGTATCTEEAFASQDPGRYRIWYDTPASLHCRVGKTCWNASPAFFTRKRLESVTTLAQRTRGSTALRTVDEYRFKHEFPHTRLGANTSLWLMSITRLGHAVDGRVEPLNPVRFEPNEDAMPNRVYKGGDSGTDPRPGFDRLRIGRVINEYGGETVIDYAEPQGACATGRNLPEPAANTLLCYPVHWHPDPEAEEIDWFHKYVVERVEELPALDGTESMTTEYVYGTPAWKLTQQEFTKKSRRTHSDFAGFDTTTVLTGVNDNATAAKRTKTVTRYFRGRGDSHTVRDVTGAVIAPDREPFAGLVAEELTYASDGDNTTTGWLTRTVSVPQATQLALRTRDDGLTPLRAWRVADAEQTSYTRSSGTGTDKRTERVVATSTRYESTYGLPTHIEFAGDTGTDEDDTCTRLDYLHNTSAHLIGLTREVRTAAGTCDVADFGTTTNLLSASRTAYDGQAYGAAPVRGLPTASWSLKGDGSGYQPDGTAVFDSLARVVRTTDPDGNSGTIAYTPATGQVYEITETNALGHREITEVEPGRGVGLRVTDANGHVSTAVYDPLGRLVEGWAAGRTPGSGAVPDVRVSYTIDANDDDGEREPPYITTRHRGHDGTVHTAVTIYDGLGRERQSQEPAVGGGRLITDTIYNGSGEVRESRNAYFAEGTPSGKLFTPDAPVPNATRYTYDGLGRVLRETPVFNGQEDPARAVSYSYAADHATVINPEGGVSYRAYSDALGRTTRIDTFTDRARTKFITTDFAYDRTGALVAGRDTEHNTWTWEYDKRGRLVSATDPDTGTATTTYDHLDRPLTSTDSRGVTVRTEYDELSRPVAEYLGATGGEQTAAYTYDTAPGGLGLPATATRYTDGLAYTMSVGGYTNDYQPTSTTLALPQAVADTWGLQTSYTYRYTYTDTGLLKSTQLPAVGALPSEKFLIRYTADGLPLSTSGTDWYSSETVYSPYGHVLRSTLGSRPYRVWVTTDHDEATGALREHRTYREQSGDTELVSDFLASWRSYTYDPAGNVTSIRERAGRLAERQCFTHDALGRMTQAWTSANQGSCTATGKSAPAPSYGDGTLNVAAGADNSGYWQSYSYDDLGNRTGLVRHNLAGDSSKDTVVEYSYGAANGSQPHTLTRVDTTVTSPDGSVTIDLAALRTYDEAGNTTSVTEHGDTQTLSWTHDGLVERVSSPGANGAVAHIGPGGKCLDVASGLSTPGQAIQLYSCNATSAQKFTFTAASDADPDTGTIKVLERCLQPVSGAANAAVRIQECDGGTAQLWQRTAAGQFRHVDSGLCAAASGGQTANSTPVVLTACNASSTAQQWEAQGETRYVYGPGGTRLLTIQERQATLHLDESEVTVHKGGALINTQRTYAGTGGAVMRYVNGTGASHMVALTSDHQGSPYAEIAMSAGMQVRVRKQDPFGAVRAQAETSAKLQSHSGFLGATRDDSTGYIQLGARLYDPAVGRFMSADPILDLSDPLQSNGYAYAHNNPVTHSDPTGLSISLSRAEKTAAWAAAGLSAAQIARAEADSRRSLTSVILAASWGILSEFLGINDAIRCFGGDLWACGELILGAIPWTKLYKLGKVAAAVNKAISAVRAWRRAKQAASAILSRARAAERSALAAKRRAVAAAKRAAQAKKAKAAAKANTTSNKAVTATKKTGNTVQKQAAARANPKSSTTSVSGGSRGGGGGGGSKPAASSKPGGSTGASSRSSGGSSGGSSGNKANETADPGCTKNSFVPGTLVLMADGSTKPIEEVRNGDRVLATDPETGETRAETVTAEITGEGEKELVTVTVDTDGEEGSETFDIVATDGHPFWVEDLREWIDATDLRAGQWLRTSVGTYVQVTAVERWTAGATVHNLTTTNLHTYHVLAGATPVLVHNCGTGPRDGGSLGPDELMSKAEGLRDEYAGEMAQLSNRKRPATVTAGYNTETGQYAAGASSKGVCAETCVVNQLGGDPSKIVFTAAIRPRTGALINICVSCEGQFGRRGFKGAGTVFDSDVLRLFDE
ncbi:ricin-type beta-trefoil lectin domain protein, partial [Streptomyces alkaliphilus]|uniref:ricin-type beta-trefoil lectin domain protein n=1 Tax=Streptomyces alkaliphilus TaxID=1472722 RepID=UPI00117C03B6